jgi:hypothetical protein
LITLGCFIALNAPSCASSTVHARASQLDTSLMVMVLDDSVLRPRLALPLFKTVEIPLAEDLAANKVSVREGGTYD